MDFWERLSYLKLYSQERRRERYQIILIWKMSQGMVAGYNIPFSFSPRRGRLAIISQYHRNACSAVRNARESSLSVKGVKLFNLMPQGLRDLNSNDTHIFKTNLDTFLSEIPDQPTVSGLIRAAKSNSILDQIPNMTITG